MSDQKLIEYETKLWEQGIVNIAGIDEVGRGCIAGPLVTASVVWDKDYILNSDDPEIALINDSKKLTEKRRNLLSEFIKSKAKQYSIVEISAEEIDKEGVGKANEKALVLAASNVENLGHLLIDHFKLAHFPQTSITKGDSLSISIAAASIIAKVYRDKLMKEKYHQMYPEYNFAKNVGYGTKHHIEMIKQYGYCAIHRKSFKLHI